MPSKCFMAKKLKYPYAEWKLKQENQKKKKTLTSYQRQKISIRSTLQSDAEITDEEQVVLKNAGGPLPDDEISLASNPSPPLAHCGHNDSTIYNLVENSSTPLEMSLKGRVCQGESSLTPPPEETVHDYSCQSSNNLIQNATNKFHNIFRPYCLPQAANNPHLSPELVAQLIKYELPKENNQPSILQYRNMEDIDTAHAILDLSAPHRRAEAAAEAAALSVNEVAINLVISSSASTSPSPLLSPALSSSSSSSSSSSTTSASEHFSIYTTCPTTAYTYEAFFASDGRSRKKTSDSHPTVLPNTIINMPSTSPSLKHRYTCSDCGKNYATSSNLSRHKQTHRSLDSSNAKKCHICGKLYVSMPALSMHILTHNLNHQCGVCGKAFSRPWLLQGHMRSHSGDKPYGCAHCGKSFADRSNLRAHMQTHSTFKNFRCKRCQKSFALKSYLNKHYESACYKDQPLPSIETPPSTPAPSENGSDGIYSPPETAQVDFSSLLATLSPSSLQKTLVHHLEGSKHLLSV